MKKQLSRIFIFILLINHLLSCDAVKRVPENQHLLTNTTVLVNNKKNNTKTIKNLLYQKPNSKIPEINLPLRLHLYNLARNNRDSLFEVWLDKKINRRKRLSKRLSEKQLSRLKKSSIKFNNWLRKIGEAPVLIDNEKTKKSVKRLTDYYVNNGWFDATATYETTKTENKRAKIKYKIETNKAFVIDSILEKIKSPIIDSLYRDIKKGTLIKSGKQYRTENFEQERERISSALRNSGIYHFNQNNITFAIDTLGTNKKINVDLKIQDRALTVQDSIIYKPFNIYTVKDVNIITDYTFENRGKPFQDSISFEGYKFYSYGKMHYNPKALTDAIFIKPKDIFKDIDKTRTYRSLSQLRTFKYPNIEYIETKDGNTLIDTIRLTPLKRFSLGFNTNVSQTANIQSIGLSLNPSLLIRNIFRGTETLEVSLVGSIGASKDKDALIDPFFDINEIGANFKLTIPRVFSPFNTDKIIPKYMSPSTKINIATTSQTNIGLDKETFSGAFSYNWRPNNKITNRFDLLSIQYVKNLNIDNYFYTYQNSYKSLNKIAQDVGYISADVGLSIPDETSEFLKYALSSPKPEEVSFSQLNFINSINERKERLTENNLILSSIFSFTKDLRVNLFDEDFSIFRLKLEVAQNLFGSESKNIAYSEFVKTEFDYIKHWDLGEKNILAVRSFFGIAIPYGNSTNIPFSKSFFAGGPNDNRAWSAYNLGPGNSKTFNEFNEANLKIAMSIEQRFNIFGSLNGAIFADAGNIWNVLDDTTDANAIFSNFKSLKDIAVGSGFGLRYDFDFFIFRFDIGFKTYDPFYSDNKRWFNDYNFPNAGYNIGINYPF